MPQTLAQTKALLAARGLRPKHRFGQNFLHDQRKLAQILAAAAIRPGDLVLEVGPGTGALSIALLEAGARLLAVEIDADLEPILRQQLAAFGDRAELLIGDVLAGKHHVNPQAMRRLSQMHGPDGPPVFTLIANLPYNVASPLLVNLATDVAGMKRAIVMVQREVADRLAAPPGGKDYGPLGVMVQAFCRVERLFTLPPGCFWPAPKVDSAVVRLERRESPATDDPTGLSALVHRLFSRRRKQLGTILGRGTPLPAGIDPAVRPEQLSIEQLVVLCRWLPAGPG